MSKLDFDALHHAKEGDVAAVRRAWKQFALDLDRLTDESKVELRAALVNLSKGVAADKAFMKQQKMIHRGLLRGRPKTASKSYQIMAAHYERRLMRGDTKGAAKEYVVAKFDCSTRTLERAIAAVYAERQRPTPSEKTPKKKRRLRH